MERKTYKVLSEVQIMGTVYPAGELIDLTDDEAETPLADGLIELFDGTPLPAGTKSEARPADEE